MNLFTGAALVIFAGVMWLKYRPKLQESRVLCAVTGMMGLMSLLAGPASWKVALIQLSLQLTVCSCCYLSLRRERVRRRRRKPACLHVHRPGGEPCRKVKTCA